MSPISLHRSPSPPQSRTVTTSPAPVIELVLSGDVDMGQAEELQRYLAGGVERGCDIVVDLSDVRLIDCVCLGVLVRSAHAAHALDRTLSLVSPSELVRLTLRATGTKDLFPVLDHRPAAVPARGRPR